MTQLKILISEINPKSTSEEKLKAIDGILSILKQQLLKNTEDNPHVIIAFQCLATNEAKMAEVRRLRGENAIK